jgi:RHS repeat-associated protein
MEGNSDLTDYDSSNQLLKQVNADGTYVAYDYDNFHRVTAAQSSTGVSTKITYDAFGNPTSTTISNAVFGNDLIAYYKFDGNMNDSSGNGYNGTNYSGSFVSGRVGSAIRFNGTTQYAELGNFKVPDVFSISMWVKNERIATNECLIGKNTATGGNQLLLGEYNSKLTTTIDTIGVDYGTKTLGYQFLVGIYEKINDTTTHVKIYKDTKLIYEADFSKLVGDTSTGKIWALGMEWDASTKSDFFQGSIDELAFYKGALDENEIKDIYAQANTKQLVAKYDFNTASGGTIVDNTNNGHTATYTGGVTFVSGAMVLNGSTGYMKLDDFTIGQDLTVAMTIKSDVVKNFSLFAKHDSAGNNILIEGYYAGWHTRIRDDSYLAGTLVANTTYTVVYTIKQISASQSRVQMYVNGTAQFDDNRVINAILADTTGKPWVIGQEWDGSTASDFFDGSIDNLAIYNYEMSSTEVSTNATALTIGTYNPGTSVYPITGEPYKSINSSASYTTDGNYITSVTDSRGNTANYDYDSTYGRLNSFRAPDETIDEATNYTYDANTDLVTSVSKTVDNKTYTNSYTYDLDKLTKITHNGFDYEFTYDSFGNPLLVKVAGTTLITNDYLDNNGLLDTATYGNGAVVKYEYDSYHRVIAKKVNNVLKSEYTYDNQGNLSSVVEHAGSTAVTYSYFYDFMNRLTKVVGSNSHNMLFTFDSYGRIDSLTNVVDGTAYKNEYVYGDQYVSGQIPGQIYNVKLNGTNQLSYAFDQLARLSTRTIATTSPYTTTYTYLDGSGANSTTTLLASMTNGSNPAFNYTYDANGNILTIKEGTVLKATYTYDKINQLIREDNIYSSKSIDYVYDIGGNIVSRTEYNYTGGSRGSLIHVYNYGYSSTWKDQMTSYDGQTITYDSIGNPLTYRDGLTFTWANGRELSGVTNGTKTGTYTYNDSGIRTSKTYDGATTNYYLNGSSIVRQVTGSKSLDFFYDENGNLYGFKEAGSMYYYLRNGQNDIIAILNSSGVQVVSYTYDSWGNPTSTNGTLATTIGADNPFRYRGYYFDLDTGLYYLNSRYYDSAVGRFINADALVSASSSLLGTNMYGYCENNPIFRSDNSGDFWESIFDVLSLGASIIEVSMNPADPWAWAGLVGDVVDLIPFVTGVGEITRAVKIASEVVDQTDNVVDVAKGLHKFAGASDDIRAATGSYEIIFKSNMNYVGKGGFGRAIDSAMEKVRMHGDEVTSIRWKSAPNETAAFIDEYLMQKRLGVNPKLTYNKIWSPGKKMFIQ